MAGYIEDRWFKKGPVDPKTQKATREKTDLHGKCLRYKVTGIPGVRARSFKSLGGPDGANAWKAKAQHESTKGEFIDPRDGRILLQDYIDQEWLPHLSGDPSTTEHVQLTVRKHISGQQLGHLSLNAIKVQQLRTWVTYVTKTLSPGTAIIVWGYLSTILQAAVEDERITRNYCKSKTVGPPAAPDQLARAWNRERVCAVRAGMVDRFRILVDLGVALGIRQGEALGLAVEDIDEANEVVHIRRQVKVVRGKLVFALPKGGKIRDVPLPASLALRIRAHLERFPARKVTLPWGNPAVAETEREAEERAPRAFELIVTSTRGNAIRRDGWNSYHWKPALVSAGIIPPLLEHVRDGKRKRAWAPSREHGFHSLRHTFASVHLDARETVVAVSKWLGHKDASITLKVYAHMMPEADGRGRRAMDAWLEDQL